MAARLRFTDQSSPAVTCDLLSGTLKLVAQSWRTRTPAVTGGYRHVPYGAQPQFSHFGVVVEQMDLVGEDSVSNLITGVNDIEDFLERARLNGMMMQRSNNIWLEANADGESGRRSLVYEGSIQYATRHGMSPLIERDAMLAKLAVSRHPLWEDTSLITAAQTNISCLGGSWYSGSGVGRAPGRIAEFAVHGRNGGGGPLSTFWIGIREKLWTSSGFFPVWEVELGTNGTDTGNAADGTASGGSKKTTSFATTPGMAKRFFIRGGQVAATWGMRGRYLVLARMKVGSSTTCAAQIRCGLSGGNAMTPKAIVYVDNTTYGTDWRLVEMGEVDIPPVGYAYSGTPTGNLEQETTLEFWAERLSGSNALDVDCFIFIPSRHMAFLDGAEVRYDTGPPAFTNPARVLTYADDTVDATVYEWWDREPDCASELAVRDFYLPHEGWLVVIAAQRATASVLADAVNPTMFYYPRWLSYRGT